MKWTAFIPVILLLSISTSLMSCQVLHIIPSSSEYCPVKRCLTLSQLIDHSSTQHNNINVTLVFLSGNHSLESVLVFADINRLSIQSVSSNTAIRCDGLGKLQFINIQCVDVSNLTFFGCIGNKVQSISKFKLEDTTFVGQEDIKGSVLELNTSSAILKRNTFYSNTGKLHSGPHCHPPSGLATEAWAGGVIRSTLSDITITRSIFEGNSAGVGGAVFSDFNSKIIIINTTFKGNEAIASSCASGAGGVLAAVNGSTIVVDGSWFISNYASGAGGVLAAESDVTISISNSHFIGNRAIGNHANDCGMIFAFDLVMLSIINTRFINNTCSGNGGVLYAKGSNSGGRGVNVNVEHSQFINNRCHYGDGGIFFVAGYNVSSAFLFSEFAGNVASHGGVICIGNTATLTIDHCNFTDNNASSTFSPPSSGGVLNVENKVNVTITYSHFVQNNALGQAGDGGVIWAEDEVNINISNCYFINNIAGINIRHIKYSDPNNHGGGGVLYAAYGVGITITQSHFTGNTAKYGDGGVIFAGIDDCHNKYEHSIIITHSQFQNNHALGDFGGGVLHVESGVPKYISLASNSFNSNSALNGGVMSSLGNFSVTITNNTFSNNSASSGGVIAAIHNITKALIHYPSSLNCERTGNDVYVARTVPPSGINISYSEFFNNFAIGESGGGVVFAANIVFLTITHSQLINNSAFNSSGGVFKLESGIIFITDTYFDHNTADRHGGVLHILQTIVNIESSVFSSNIANGSGGIIYSKLSSTATLNRSKVNFNKAGLDGGAITTQGGSITIIDGSFGSNSASNDGGVISSTEATVEVHGGDFDHNRAGYNGGVVLSKRGMVNVYGGSYDNNFAQHDGGVIASYEGTVMVYDESVAGILEHNNMVVVPSQHGSVADQGSAFIHNSAGHDGGVFQMYQGILNISGSTYQNNVALNDGGVIHAYQSTVNVTECSFNLNLAINDGGAINAFQGTLLVSNDTSFSRNKADNNGGAINAYELDAMLIIGNKYDGNMAGNRGGVWFVYQGSVTISQSVISSNEAVEGGVIYADQGSVSIDHTSCVGNSAFNGGAFHTLQSFICAKHSSFVHNSANNSGGAWFIDDNEISFHDVSFVKNFANSGAATYSSKSNMSLYSVLFKHNSAKDSGAAMFLSKSTLSSFKLLTTQYNRANVGAIYLLGSKAYFHNHTLFLDNVGSLVVFNSFASLEGTTTFVNCSELMKPHDTTELREGGALTIFKSNVIIHGNATLTENHAENGGAIHATESKVFINGELMVAYNTAKDTGGGIYIDMSEVLCESNSSTRIVSNSANNKGGGVHAISSVININGNLTSTHDVRLFEHTNLGASLYFTDNIAMRGGGLCLEVSAKVYVLKSTPSLELFPSVNFTGNFANYGGAVYVSDDSNLGLCNPHYNSHYKARECFFQVLQVYGSASLNFTVGGVNAYSIMFSNNYANVSGSSLFGGLLDRCKLQYYTEAPFESTTYANKLQHQDLVVNGITYMTNISNINNSDIGSEPVQLCFCKGGLLNCDYQPDSVRVIKGKTFSISVIAVDQVKHPVSATIHSALLTTSGGGFGKGQAIQNISEMCTDLKFNLFSPNDKEELIMYAEGPCVSSPLSQRRITIKFTACDSCPIGFERHTDEDTTCECVCDSRLAHYVTKCNASTQLLEREGSFWMSYVSSSENTSSGYLIYDHCPLNYCKPPTPAIGINLSTLDGADTQCTNGRSGLLCGSCQSNLSLSLGSSRCIPCDTNWTTILAIVIASLIAGIALVTLLLVLNMTVAVGTLNAIIFYANIVASGNSSFLPFSKPNLATVFVSWLNLEIGFDVCFFAGMDAYWKTLLQLAFPMYVIILVAVVIFVSECSVRFAQLIGRRNPVATLATLILLSYTKFLNTIIASLSYARLIYPDGTHRVVWLPDASVEYLKGKHVALFILSIIILLAGIIYTTLLFLWQWLLKNQDKKIFSWTRCQKLCHFLEPYHAPYIFEQRYWTGLLLFVRAVLYIISAVNVTSDPLVPLLSTVILVGLLPLIKGIMERKIYKKRVLDIMEMILYFNLISFAALSMKTGTTKHQIVVAHISVLITFSFLLIVILYHLFQHTRLRSVTNKCNKVVTSLVCKYYFRYRIMNTEDSHHQPVFDFPESHKEHQTELLLHDDENTSIQCSIHELDESSGIITIEALPTNS